MVRPPPPALEYDSHPLMLRRTIPALQLHILLLLAALFNALAGVPLHEARHMREAVPTATLTFTAQPMRWPFAARDPPPAQRA